MIGKGVINSGLAALLLSALLLSGGPMARAGGVYKWQDGDGRWHYGDRPPAYQRSREMYINRAATPLDAQERRRDKRGLRPAEQRRLENIEARRSSP